MQPIGEMTSQCPSDRHVRKGLIPKHIYVRAKIKTAGKSGSWEGLEERKGRANDVFSF